MADRMEEKRAQALDWVIRLRDAEPRDWEAFTLWLEADPDHSAAYDEAALMDEELEGLAPPAVVAPAAPSAPPFTPALPADRRRTDRRQFLGWAAAAALVGMIGVNVLRPGGGDFQTVATGPGEHRTVELADGSRIDLNGGTKVLLDPDRPRFARLEQGEALFTVIHDDSAPFEVEAGEVLLRDMGTVFNVIQTGEALEVAVAEGEVLFEPDGEKVTLSPNMVLRRQGDDPAQLGRMEPDAITGWREGRLVYASAPVAEVAADLSRNLGVPVAASPRAALRSFTGTIRTEGEPAEVLRRAGSVMGVGLHRSGDGWMLDVGPGGSP